jgi:protein SCO1/2
VVTAVLEVVLKPGAHELHKIMPISSLTKSQYRRLAWALMVAAVALCCLLPFVSSPFGSQDYYGRILSRKAPSFQLKDSDDRQVALEDFQGKFIYLMFGYLGCEKVCHTQALTFYNLHQRLQSDRIQFLYLGMDPARDTPEKVAGYFDSRGSNFLGLMADSMQHAQAVAADYHAYFNVEPGGEGEQRIINHPGFIYLIDPDGNLRLVYSGANLDLQRMLSDLNQLAAGFS